MRHFILQLARAHPNVYFISAWGWTWQLLATCALSGYFFVQAFESSNLAAVRVEQQKAATEATVTE